MHTAPLSYTPRHGQCQSSTSTHIYVCEYNPALIHVHNMFGEEVSAPLNVTGIEHRELLYGLTFVGDDVLMVVTGFGNFVTTIHAYRVGHNNYNYNNCVFNLFNCGSLTFKFKNC